jgi:hypothetical protein
MRANTSTTIGPPTPSPVPKVTTSITKATPARRVRASNVFAATGATVPCAPSAPATPKAGRLKSDRTGRKSKRCGGGCKTRTGAPSGNNAPGSSNPALGRSNNTMAFDGGRSGDWKASRPNRADTWRQRADGRPGARQRQASSASAGSVKPGCQQSEKFLTIPDWKISC